MGNKAGSLSQDQLLLQKEAKLVRETLAASRSDTLVQLFDLLLKQSLENRKTREIDIIDYLNPNQQAAKNQGSRIRVLVHRLRVKIDKFYEGKDGARLVIPTGEYCLTLAPESSTGPELSAPVPPAATAVSKFHGKAALFALIIALNLGCMLLYYADRLPFGARQADDNWPIAEMLSQNSARTTIAIGDYFLFAKFSADGQEDIVQDLQINDADVFREYANASQIDHKNEKLYQKDIHAFSSAIVSDVAMIFRKSKAQKPKFISGSQLTIEAVRRDNIVFIGPMDALPYLLNDPLEAASNFKCGYSCYVLIDKTNLKQYKSDSPFLLPDSTTPRKDYGYIASFQGPTGKQILVISGTGDAGVKQMVDLISSTKAWHELRSLTDGAPGFEAIYKVKTLFDQGFNRELIAIKPLQSQNMW
jgi:hypothetical protein